MQLQSIQPSQYRSANLIDDIESVDGQGFGAVVRNVDLRDSSGCNLASIRELMYQRRLVVIKHQHLSAEEYINFAENFGTPVPYLQENYHHPDYPVIFVSSNVEQDGKKMGVARTGGYWHSDTSFQEKPQPLTMLYPQIIPKIWQRSTLFIDMAEVYRELPLALKNELDKARFMHSGKWRYKIREEDAGLDLTEILQMIDDYSPPVSHPAVLTHPVTGDRAVYGSRGFTIGVDGMHQADADELLGALFDFAENERFVRKVFWEMGDVIVWDNRYLLHRSGRAESASGDVKNSTDEEKTMMYRITLDDGYSLSV